MGKPEDQISNLVNADEAKVHAGILRVQQWMASNSREMVVAHLHEQAIIASEPIGRTLAEAQSAMRLVEPAQVDIDTGKIVREAVYEPDHPVRIEAVKAAATVVSAVAEKGPAVSVQVGVQNNIGGSGRSFEERVRAKRQEMQVNRQFPMLEGQIAEPSAADEEYDDPDDTSEYMTEDDEDLVEWPDQEPAAKPVTG